MTGSKTAAPSRFLADSTGTYDLASVSAIVSAGKTHGDNAMLITEGGSTLHTGTPYPQAVAAWSAYLEEETPAPAAGEGQAPAAPKE
jgi:hypothetical protein